MKKKMLTALALLLVMTTLSGCGAISLLAPNVTEATDLPHLLVQQIDVAMYPSDTELARHYESQQNLTAILQILRTLVTTKAPEKAPDLEDGQTYYTVTTTYSCGDSRVYYIVGYQFLKAGDDDWCVIDFNKAMELTQYLRTHPSENGTYVPPAVTPTTPSLPVETEPAETES